MLETIELKELEKILNTDIKKGIKNIKENKKFGKNIIEYENFYFVLIKYLLEEIFNPLNFLLIVASILSYFLKKLDDFILIIIILLTNIIISLYYKIKTEIYLRNVLKKELDYYFVIRNGKKIKVREDELLVGDLILLSEGKVPADIRIIEGKFLVNESILTGEFKKVLKTSEIPKKIEKITDYTNILFYGSYIEKGEGKGIIIRVGKNTYFGKLTNKALRIKKTSLFERRIKKLMKKIILISLILFFITLLFNFNKYNLVDLIIFSIAILIGIIPEGLPLMINLILTHYSKDFAKKGLLFRKIYGIEEIGEIKTIVFDKTGTLTKNRLKFLGYFGKLDEKKALFYAYLASYDNKDEIDKYFLNLNFPKIKREIIDFDYKNMRSGCKINNLYIFKGAPEKMIEECNYYFDEKINREYLKRKLKEFYEKGYRVLGLMMITHKKIFLGFLLFEDPLKEDIKDTIKKFREMGINLKICSGDSKDVLISIAKKLEFDNFCITNKPNPNCNIFYRMTPEDKLELVKKLEEVMAIGDGINDILMLREANLGISVENADNFVKMFSDAIIMKKDLSIVLEGIKIGKKIIADLTDYVIYILSSNFFEVLAILYSSFKITVDPKLILILNLITDTYPIFIIKRKITKQKSKSYYIILIPIVEFLLFLLFSLFFGLSPIKFLLYILILNLIVFIFYLIP